MEYNFKSRLSGKNYSQMIALKLKIESGMNCFVATSNPEKTKKEFKYMTGVELQLIKRSENVYAATLKEIKNGEQNMSGYIKPN